MKIASYKYHKSVYKLRKEKVMPGTLIHRIKSQTINSSLPANPTTTPPTPGWKNNVVQLLNGTCGAGPSTGVIDPGIKSLWNVHNDAKTYYFSVVDISGSTVTVKSYGGNLGNYSLIDTFTVTR